MARVQGKCIFCSGTGLTKEHIFPNWARHLLDSLSTHSVSRINFSLFLTLNTMSFSPSLDEKQGELPNKRLRVVCKSCNGGWMSSIESQTKDPLTRIIRGDALVMNTDIQRLISLWAGLRAAVFERDHPQTAAITSAELQLIHQTQTLPPNWKVLIARNLADDWQTRIFHMGAAVSSLSSIITNDPNTQITIIGMKNVVISVLSSTTTNASTVVEKLSPAFMTQIHPYKDDIEWPTLRGANSEELRQHAYGNPLYI